MQPIRQAQPAALTKFKAGDFKMKRYCIICNSMFGCVKDGVKRSCKTCQSSRSCFFLYDSSAGHLVPGICEDCWETHGRMRLKETVHAS